MIQTVSAEPAEPELGLPKNLVRLCAYSSRWPEHYRRERQRLSRGLEPLPHCIAHVGSTAVAGLTAKPIIDILLGVAEPSDRDEISEIVQQLGYTAHGEKGVPGRLFYTWGEPRMFHLHLVDYGADIWHKHILFRNCLRTQSRLAAEYVSIKEELADMFPADRDSYTQGKAEFIESALSEYEGLKL